MELDLAPHLRRATGFLKLHVHFRDCLCHRGYLYLCREVGDVRRHVALADMQIRDARWSQASILTGRQTPLVTKVGPQSQPYS